VKTKLRQGILQSVQANPKSEGGMRPGNTQSWTRSASRCVLHSRRMPPGSGRPGENPSLPVRCPRRWNPEKRTSQILRFRLLFGGPEKFSDEPLPIPSHEPCLSPSGPRYVQSPNGPVSAEHHASDRIL
jgi:hypothetical protein